MTCGVVIAATRAFASQRDRPLTTIRPLLAAVGAHATGVAAVPPEMLAGLATLIPEVGERFRKLPAPLPSVDSVSAALRLVTEAASEQPIVLVVDDAPDADAESVAVLGELLRHPRPGLLLILAGRSDAWLASPLFPDLKSGVDCVARVSLGPLTERHAADLVGIDGAVRP